MTEKKQVKIGDVKEAEKDEKKEERKSESHLPEPPPEGADRRRARSALGAKRQHGSREFRKKDDKPKTFKDFLADDVKPFRFLTTHFPHYQDHYQYPGYIPFVRRQISETLVASGWDEKQDNERMRRMMIAERLKRRKKFAKPGIRLRRDPTKVTPLKFDDQLILGETVVRKLSGRNPRYPQPLYQWHYYHGEYREMVKPCDDHEDIMRQSPGLIHVDSLEGQWQIEDEQAPDEIASESSTEVEEEEEEKEEGAEGPETEPPAPEEEGMEEEMDEEEEEVVEEEEKEEEGEEEEGEEEGKEMMEGTPLEIQEKLKFLEDEPPIRFLKKKKLFNLFNFTDRGVQGEVTMTGEKTTQTIPVPMGRLNKYITTYIIYDVYQKDIQIKEQQKQRQLERQMDMEAENPDEVEAEPEYESSSDEEASMSKNFNKITAHRAKILERMVVQNTLFDFTADMKFYEDPIDEYNKEEGSLLPLWTFKRSEFQGLSVTCIQFCPSNPDIFGVTYGSFEFTQRSERGYITVYSIKDPLNPEYKRECNEGVTCFDYHPAMESYLAYATYDGAVHCCDTRDPSDDFQLGLHSHAEQGHQAFIWKLMWDPSLEELMFYTISADGMFYKWNVRNSVVVRSIALNLNYPAMMEEPLLTNPFPFLNEITEPKPLQAVATTMELDPNNTENVFIGTSDGMVLKCCLRFTTDYLAVYHSHCLPVSRIHFNMFLRTLFITSAEDRKVNIHEEGRKKPLYTLIQNTGVVDVMWAPYSSTVFALLTSDCQVNVYDLSLNQSKPLCKQFILWRYGQTTLTRLIFHPTRPIIFIGDSNGTIVSFKLSPNLRVKPKKQKRQKVMEPVKMEMLKLETCLNNTREPDVYPLPEDDKKNLVDLDSDSDDEDRVMIGCEVYRVPPDREQNDISRGVKRRIFHRFQHITDQYKLNKLH